jgi:hypothetical protein
MPDRASDGTVVDWLLDGDPAIRWQVMRDLLDEPASTWEAERRRVTETGWVADLLSRQGPEGDWPKGRWTDSVWTLLLLVACGLPESYPAGRAPVEKLLGRFMPTGEPVDGAFLLRRVDLCHLGFWLGLGAYFLDDDQRLAPLGQAVLSAQYEDGGWNCQMRNYPERRHSSFHTTFNVLENLRLACSRGAVAERAFHEADARALELMLAHRLYRSDKTGAVISERFTHLTYPWHWHYAFLRARLPAPDARDRRRPPWRRDPASARPAKVERALAITEADPGHIARRDGAARRREPLEHAKSSSDSPETRRRGQLAHIIEATHERPWATVLRGRRSSVFAS